ncbi:DUF4157 domain-containing protein [Nannocystaceae bacterium ST9]
MPRVVQRESATSVPSTRPRATQGLARQPPRYGIGFADRGGEPLPGGVRTKMERAFASDFGSVRVHEGPQSSAIGAIAHTEGSNIHFAPGHYRPHTSAGQRTIGHELAHVVQQSRGMVQANRSIAGVPINDSPALERQADLAGARASLGQPTGLSTSSTNASSGAAQRVVQRAVVGDDLKGMLAWQKQLQTDAKRDPDTYKYKYTTVGFEHEFGQMQGGPIRGVDHLELARSTAPDLPYTGIPFVLETDAANSIELVSPPLLIETKSSGKFTSKSKRKPVPLVEDIRKIDGMFRTMLASAVNYNKQRKPPERLRGALDNYDYTNKTLAELVAAIQAKSGITLPLADVSVEPFQLSPATIGEFDEDHATITRQTLEAIEVGPSFKGAERNQPHIITQINFATDAATADLLQRESDKDSSLRPVATPAIVGKFREVEAQIVELLVGPQTSANLRIFYNALARSLSGQIAVPYMDYFKSVQEAAFEHEELMTTVAATPDVNGRALEVLQLAESISSHVKDTSGVWIKDMVVNLGLGILTRAEWQAARTRISTPLVATAISDSTAVHVSDVWPQAWRADTRAEIRAATVAALARVVEIIDNDIKPGTRAGFDARVAGLHLGQQDAEDRLEFAQHRARDVGPRQDTYIRSKNVQTPLWDRRLHVVETRGDSLDKQLELIAKVGG